MNCARCNKPLPEGAVTMIRKIHYCLQCGRKKRNKQKTQARRERNQAMRDLGLKKVRGARGGIYWE